MVKPGFVVTKCNCEQYFIGPNTLIFRGRFQKFRFRSWIKKSGCLSLLAFVKAEPPGDCLQVYVYIVNDIYLTIMSFSNNIILSCYLLPSLLRHGA